MKHYVPTSQLPSMHQRFTSHKRTGKLMPVGRVPRGAIYFFCLVVGMTATGLALAGFERSHALHVTGTIQEVPLQEALTPMGISYTALDLWTGSLAGTGVVHFFSTQAVGDTVIATAKNALFTPDGDLVFSVVGTQTGTEVKGVMTAEGGTGIYRNAKGQINLEGAVSASGVTFTYNGTITHAE